MRKSRTYYSRTMTDEVCALIAGGMPAEQIPRRYPSYPAAHTIRRWARQNLDGFGDRLRAARATASLAAAERRRIATLPKPPRIGEHHHNALLTDAAVDWIRELHATGAGGYKTLGRRFGVDSGTIRDIVKGRRRAVCVPQAGFGSHRLWE